VIVMSTIKQQPLPPMEVKSLDSGSTVTKRPTLQEWKGMVSRAAARSGLSQKAMAVDLGISEAQLSSTFAYEGETGPGQKHLSFWRLRHLPPEFWKELIDLLIAFYDLGTTRKARDDSADLAQAVRELLKVHGR